jgi:hypothetical protein
MPILAKCTCGKAVNVRDDLAGKAVKCPGCGNPIKVVASQGGQASAKATQAAPQQRVAVPAAPKAALDDLFSEEGFDRHVAQVCPVCRVEMQAGAVLCTKCGYNKQTGERLESHKTAGVDISHGEVFLQKAGKDMDVETAMQAKMANAGMPWWVLALILFFIVSAVSIAVVAINVARRVDGEGSFNAMATFLVLGFGAVQTVALGAYLVILVKAFKQSIKEGLLTMFVPLYILYFVFKNFKDTWRPFAAYILLSCIAGGLIFGAIRAGL